METQGEGRNSRLRRFGAKGEPQRTKTVLVVDDEDVNRELMRELLERRGYSVCEGRNGQEAIMQMEKDLPDLVLLDIHMPLLDGFEAVKQIRKDSRLCDIPVLAFTTEPLEKEAEFKRAGFDGLVPKPLDAESMTRIEAFLVSSE